MKSSKYISIKKLLFEICYLCFVIIGGGLAGYYLSQWGVESLNSVDGQYESFFQQSFD